MATINRPDGQVIAWGGQVDGPKTVYNQNGAPTLSHTYTAELGIGASETKEVVVVVTDAAKMVLGPNSENSEDLVKECVVRFIEERYADWPLTQAKEQFWLDDVKMVELRGHVIGIS